jgi:hypothetical protein
MKKSRKNLKEKLRLQRRLNEMRNICSAMDENTVKDEKKDGKDGGNATEIGHKVIFR